MYCSFCGVTLEEGMKKEMNNHVEPVQKIDQRELRSGQTAELPEQNSNTLTSDHNDKPVHQPQKKRKYRMKYIFTSVISIALTLVVLGLTGVLDLKQAAKKGGILEKSFEEPEDAITYYFEHLKDGDLNGMLAACDVNEKATNFDFDKSYDWLGVWMLNTLLPPEYDTYQGINKYVAGNTFALAIKNQYLALTASDNEAVKTLLEGESVTDLGDFETELIDPEAVRELKLVRMDLASPANQKSDRIRKNLKKAAGVYGGDDFKDYVVLYELDDQYYMAGFFLYHYKSGWKITSLQSSLAGINGIYPTTMSEYKNTINN
jgi:hypothetical protein